MFGMPLPVHMKPAQRGIKLALDAVEIPGVAVVPRPAVICHLVFYGTDGGCVIGRDLRSFPSIPVFGWKPHRRFPCEFRYTFRLIRRAGQEIDQAGAHRMPTRTAGCNPRVFPCLE